MSSTDLVSQLRAAGDPLHVIAAEALVLSHAEVDRLRARVELLEGVARLNSETIRSMQRAAAEAATALHTSRLTLTRRQIPVRVTP